MTKIVGIILAAGTSSRFTSKTPKQLYIINNKSVVSYSIDAMVDYVDKLIIVVNKNIELKDIIKKNNIVVIENNINERKASLNTAIKYIKENLINVEKIIIHDAARPFITKIYIEKIIKESIYENKKYVQYVLKLTNGLYNTENNLPVDREKYVELCTPICISCENLKIQESDEIISSIDFAPHFLYGDYNNLRKITTIKDVSEN